MRNIYQTTDHSEANRLLELLEREGIEMFVNGAYQAGGIAAQTSADLFTLGVEEDDVAHALEIIECRDARHSASGYH